MSVVTIHIEYDENDPESYWAAVAKLRDTITRITEHHTTRRYFANNTIEWWARWLDIEGLPKDAKAWKVGRVLRGLGFVINDDAVQRITRYRQETPNG